MKNAILLTLLAAASLTPLTAQASGSSAARGALIGGVAGAIIGSGGDRHDVVAGAVFGATAGALIGASSDNHRHGGYYRGGPRVNVSYGVGYSHRPYYNHSYRHRPYYRHAYYGRSYPSFHYSYSRPAYYYEDYQPVQVVATPVAVQSAPVQDTQPAAASPQNVTIINNYYGGSSNMGTANGMFGR